MPLARGRILHIAWRYPPCYCSPTGSTRNHALSEGLQAAGWDVTVVTGRPVDNPCPCWQRIGVEAAPATGAARTLYVDVRDRRPVRWYHARTSSSKIDRLLRKGPAFAVIPFDATTDFLRRTTRLARQLAREESFDVIMVSGRPIAGAATAVRLARRLRAASVVHLHDSITRMARDRGHRVLRAVSLRRALRALRRADLVLSISPEEAARDAKAARTDIVVLEGGFDEHFWAEIHADAAVTPVGDVFAPDVADTFRVVYTGRLYDFQEPSVALTAIRLLRDRLQQRGRADDATFCVFGPESDQWGAAVTAAGLDGAMRHLGLVDRHRASIALVDSHAAILLGRKDDAPGNFGQKLYDYVASGVPIVFCPAGADDSGARTIAAASAGIATRDPAVAAEYLLDRFDEWEQGGRGAPAHRHLDPTSRASWSFATRVAQLDELLRDLVAGERSDPRVLLVIDRLMDLGGAEGSTTLVLNGLHGHGVSFSAVGLYDGIDLRDRAALEAGGARFFEPKSGSLVAQVRCVVAAVRKVRPDLIHATLARAEMVARLAGLITRTPVITSIVSEPYGEEARRMARSPRRLELYRRVDSLLSRRATFAYHAISEAAADGAVAALGIDRSRIALVPRGRDAERLGRNTGARRQKARAALDIGDDTWVVLNVGRQDYQKGQVFLIDAFAQIAAGHDAVLVVAGREGNATRSLQEQVRAAGLADQVRFLGMRDDVPELLCAADVFAFPSLFEGLGGALLEALALEVPIVAFDTPAVREAVGDANSPSGHGAGILVPVRDADALAAALLTVLEDPTHAADLTERGHRRFEEKFTNDRYLAAMLRLYQDTVAAARLRHPRRGRRTRSH